MDFKSLPTKGITHKARRTAVIMLMMISAVEMYMTLN
jgi:hypothetical protein